MNFKNVNFVTGADAYDGNYYMFILGGETTPITKEEYLIIKKNKSVLYNTETREVIVCG